MIELPRACMRADEIAEHADFFSFGTNDLTQTALGFSRDDAEGKFLTYYLQHDVLEQNPFETLDRAGVGDLMRIAVERGRSVKEDLKMGICGEHGGEAKSVAFCDELGLDYVSCSPYRVPLARLAAAQAALAATGAAAVRRRRRLTPATTLHHDLVERLALEVRHLGVVRRIADGDQDERPLVLGPAEDLAEEAHRARRVRSAQRPASWSAASRKPTAIPTDSRT